MSGIFIWIARQNQPSCKMFHDWPKILEGKIKFWMSQPLMGCALLEFHRTHQLVPIPDNNQTRGKHTQRLAT